MEYELKTYTFFFIFTKINCIMEKLISTILLLYSFVILSQETNSNNFNYNPIEFSGFITNSTIINYSPVPKNYFSELEDNLKN